MSQMICSAAVLLGISLATATATAKPAHSASKLSCQEYGYQAVRLARDAEIAKCGLTGPRWSKNLADHIEWCQNVSPVAWLADLKERKIELKKCIAKD